MTRNTHTVVYLDSITHTHTPSCCQKHSVDSSSAEKSPKQIHYFTGNDCFLKIKLCICDFFFFKKRSMFWVELMDLGFSVTDITLLVWFFIWDLLIIIILQNTPDLSFKAFLTPSSYFYMLTYKKPNLNVVHLQHVGSACEILTVCSRRKKLKSPPQKKRTGPQWSGCN